MLSLDVSDRIGIFGRTGDGKTHFLKHQVLARLMKEGIPVIAIDPKDELSVKGRPRDTEKVGPLKYRWTATQVAMQPEILEFPKLSLAVVPDELDQRKSARAFSLIAKLLKAIAEEGRARHVVLVCEEVQWWAHHCAADLVDVATIWRDFKVTVVLVTQRPVGIPIAARAMLNQIISFSQTEPADVDSIRIRTALTDPTFHERIQRLPAREFCHWRSGVSNGEERKEERGSGGGVHEVGDGERSGAPGSGGSGSNHPQQQNQRDDGLEELALQAGTVDGEQAEERLSEEAPTSDVAPAPGKPKPKAKSKLKKKKLSPLTIPRRKPRRHRAVG